MISALTDTEMKEWLAMLGPTRLTQIAAVDDLLEHAGEDGMSSADRSTCLRAYARLTGKGWKPKALRVAEAA